ncbi:DUF3667 domain-containing protein [Undibacterium cyanobacteriorum]|uniref:DUF3667 domain-containing protein n=1 Tax=Undibacterium cyanobacteriorum TaxID=3073561 RepID=A0ABY9RFV0_9BURK|nr:DUF3667 domain-containing protein [Undibacterium sp. 20NA77.5]WMW79180.1 DUF3667 domain-containing protein [Undibacterium sp. 20NA77.5]
MSDQLLQCYDLAFFTKQMSFYQTKFHGYCLNCDHPAPKKFCPECGQETHHEKPSLWHFIHEYLHHYIALEGKLIGTLRTLIFSPGVLSQEYLCGRKQKYVGPLALYLSVSFVFFLVLLLIVNFSSSDNETSKHQTPTPTAASTLDKTSSTLESSAISQTSTITPKFTPSTKTVSQKMPYAYFAFIPVYALLLAFFYRKRSMLYGEHLVFALHLHAGTFAILLILSVFPNIHGAFVIISILLHQYLSFHHFYRGRWWPQALRYLALSASYSIICFLSIAVATFIYSK